jgi:hypothetical protein
VRRRIEAARPPREKGKRFTLKPSKAGAKAEAGSDEDPEERRARLLARKAELEARRAQQQEEPKP